MKVGIYNNYFALYNFAKDNYGNLGEMYLKELANMNETELRNKNPSATHNTNNHRNRENLT